MPIAPILQSSSKKQINKCFSYQATVAIYQKYFPNREVTLTGEEFSIPRGLDKLFDTISYSQQIRKIAKNSETKIRNRLSIFDYFEKIKGITKQLLYASTDEQGQCPSTGKA